MEEKIGLLKNIGLEFKKFALRGNVIDLAVGIIIGAAFNKIVNSLVADIITPPIGALIGRVDFSEFYIPLTKMRFESLAEAKTAGAPVIAYGTFIDAFIAFILTAFAVFLLVKFINKLNDKNDKEPEQTPTTRPCPFCYSKISVKASRCPNCTSEIEPKVV